MISLFLEPHLCSYAEQTSQTVTKTFWNAVTVVYVVEETVACLGHSMEEVTIVLVSKTKRKDASLSSDLLQ